MDNVAAIDVIIKHVQRQLDERQLTLLPSLGTIESLSNINFTVMERTPQLSYLQTIIRDKTTSRSDFIFYVERLSRLLIEEGLNKLQYRETHIVTPTKSDFKGLELATKVFQKVI